MLISLCHVQSERTTIYRTHAHDLVSNGHAYRCFCSSERLDSLARHRNAAGLSAGYDRQCADIPAAESEERASKNETHVVRLRANDYPMFNDLVYGKTGQNRPKSKLDMIERVWDDPILVKSDGHPTYHLANVVDDHLMDITHVIRGTEWMPSTPMHVALYNAFNWTPPSFGHVPLLVDKAGQKLSKRNADIDLSSFKDKQGLFPETLVNFAALLGWSHTQKSDVFNLEELEQIVRPLPPHTVLSGNTNCSVQPKNHPRQHHRRLRKALVPPKSTRPTSRRNQQPYLPRHDNPPLQPRPRNYTHRTTVRLSHPQIQP